MVGSQEKHEDLAAADRERDANRMQDDDRKRLETMIEERSRELAMAQDDLAALLSSVSHDLRAPIRHIQSFADLLAERLQAVPDSQSQHYLEVISNAATDMNRSLDYLVALFKINRSAMHVIRMDLNNLVNRVVNAFQPETTGRSIEWDIGDLPDVSGDMMLLQIVFTNLVSNALKFTRLRDVARIRIAVAESGSDDSGLIVLTIKDNGIGFDMQYQDKLFGIFQKMHNQKDFEGAGIGLAYVKHIVQIHGGHVWAKSACDQGAEFFISLPKCEKG